MMMKQSDRKETVVPTMSSDEIELRDCDGKEEVEFSNINWRRAQQLIIINSLLISFFHSLRP